MNRIDCSFFEEVCKFAGTYLKEENNKKSLNILEITRKSEDIVIKEIRSRFPQDSIETQVYSTIKGNSEYTWTVHALDGKSNFSRGIPYFGVGLGLIGREQIVAGGIYVPCLNQFTFSAKDKGTQINHERAHVTHVTDWKDSIGCLAPTTSVNIAEIGSKLYLHGTNNPFRIASMGAGCGHAPAVASGARDWWITPDIPPYDIAIPGALIISEAGGRVTDQRGTNFNHKSSLLVSSNGYLHDTLLSVINGEYK